MVTVSYRLRESFRLPAGTDPAPRPSRLVGVCVWTAMLALLGLPITGRVTVAIITGSPAWLAPTMLAIGLLGIILTIAAFAAIHQRRLPWLLLAAATAALGANAAFAV